MRQVTSSQLRKLLLAAAAGEKTDLVVEIDVTVSSPRLFDESADFKRFADDGWHGCYVIYHNCCSDHPGPSRIQYIGKGWPHQRGPSHLREKPALRKNTRNHELKWVLMSWRNLKERDDDAAWLLE